MAFGLLKDIKNGLIINPAKKCAIRIILFLKRIDSISPMLSILVY